MNTDDDDDDLVLQCLYDEFTLLEVVIEGDFESVQSILDDNPTIDELNERDRTGKVRFQSYASGLRLSTNKVKEIKQAS